MNCTRIIAFACIACLFALSCRPQISDRETRYKVAMAYGLKGFKQVDQIRFTINVKKSERRFRRSWIWHPKADSVVYNDVFRYSRQDTALSYFTDKAQIESWFINDMTWLLFPLHLVWEPNLTITEDDVPQPLPTGKGRAHRMTVVYPGGGHLDDVYKLYIGEDDRLVAWVFHGGGDDDATEVTTWEDHRHVGPITVSMDRRSPDGNYRVWFTDVAVKLEGLDTWIEAR